MLHFVNWTARASFEAIGVEVVAMREKDRKAAEEADYYSVKETQAAITLVRMLVRRMRARQYWKKTVELGAEARADGRIAPCSSAAEVFAEIPRPTPVKVCQKQKKRRAPGSSSSSAEGSKREHPGIHIESAGSAGPMKALARTLQSAMSPNSKPRTQGFRHPEETRELLEA